MNISDKQLKKFIEICKNRMGVEISEEKAMEQAQNLVTLISITRGVPPKNEVDVDWK